MSIRTLKSVGFAALAIVFLLASMPYVMHAPLPRLNFPSTGVKTVDDGIDWEATIAMEARHSDDSHKIQGNPAAQARLATTLESWKVAPPQFDPKSDNVLCKAVQFARGLYHAIWSAEPGTPDIGTVSVYNESGAWLTSYSGNPRGAFTDGYPKGAQNAGLVNCNTLTPPPLPG